MKTIKVYLNPTNLVLLKSEGGVKKRRVVEAELIEDRKLSVLVKLPDGNIIKRMKARDVVWKMS